MNDQSDILAGGFVCRRCGQCCREPGYVYLTAEEVDRIAAFLGISVENFTKRCTRLAAGRRGLSLEEDDGGGCIFLNERGECAIQDVKPSQCADFPSGWQYRRMNGICAGWTARDADTLP